jgi:Tfp pilus assembly protein PilN
MIEINLLPKEQQKRAIEFSVGKSGLYVVAGAIAVVVALAGITLYQKSRLTELEESIDRANQRAAMLQKDIQLVDALTDVKTKISNRMAAIEKLDSHRSGWVRIMENVTKNVPEFVWLARFKEIPPQVKKENAGPKGLEGNPAAQTPAKTEAVAVGAHAPSVLKCEVEGFAFTLNALAAFMINMMRSDHFDNVELKATDEVKLEEIKAYNFTLSADLHYLSDDALRQLGQADSTLENASIDENDYDDENYN